MQDPSCRSIVEGALAHHQAVHMDEVSSAADTRSIVEAAALILLLLLLLSIVEGDSYGQPQHR